MLVTMHPAVERIEGTISRSNMKATKKLKKTNGAPFDAQAFLDSAGVARKVVEFRRKETIFSQERLAAASCTFNAAA